MSNTTIGKFKKKFPNFKGAIWSEQQLCRGKLSREEVWVSIDFVAEDCVDRVRVRETIENFFEEITDKRFAEERIATQKLKDALLSALGYEDIITKGIKAQWLIDKEKEEKR